MLTYATRVEFANCATGEAVVAVQSKLTHYRVIIEQEEIILRGPGVDKELSEGEVTALDCFETAEAKALAAVLMFEAGE